MGSQSLSVILEIKVVPSSGRSELIRDKSGILKLFVKSAPERGLANHEVVAVLAKKLGLPKSAISLISGQSSRLKRISIASSYSQRQLLEKLGVALPESQLWIRQAHHEKE